jgi:hypothetical protein
LAFGLGAWIADGDRGEIDRPDGLVLGNPVGIKVSDRETRDILDVFAMLQSEFSGEGLC